MSRISLFSCFLIVLLLVLGCGKDDPSPTIIKGRVIDNNTGDPIAEASYYYSYSEDVDGKPFYTEKWLKTDSRGEFVCTFPTSGVGPTISKDGYLSKDVGKDMGYTNQYNYKYKLTAGTTNDVGDQRMYPKDGVFKLVLTNVTGVYSKIYGHFVSNLIEKETPAVGIDISKDLSKGKLSTQVYKINSDDWVKVYWGGEYFGSPQFAPHIDSFYVGKIDTAVYQIDF